MHCIEENCFLPLFQLSEGEYVDVITSKTDTKTLVQRVKVLKISQQLTKKGKPKVAIRVWMKPFEVKNSWNLWYWSSFVFIFKIIVISFYMDFVKCVHLNNKYEIVSKTFSVWKQTNKGQHSQVITCICNFGWVFFQSFRHGQLGLISKTVEIVCMACLP